MAKQKSYIKRPELEKWTINRCLSMEEKRGLRGSLKEKETNAKQKKANE